MVLLGPSLLLGGAFVVYAPDVLLPPRRRLPATSSAPDGSPSRGGGAVAVGAGAQDGGAAPARAQARRLHALDR